MPSTVISKHFQIFFNVISLTFTYCIINDIILKNNKNMCSILME